MAWCVPTKAAKLGKSGGCVAAAEAGTELGASATGGGTWSGKDATAFGSDTDATGFGATGTRGAGGCRDTVSEAETAAVVVTADIFAASEEIDGSGFCGKGKKDAFCTS